ncbi:MAG: TolC family protein [Deltaproteobacteria bacterium]|nr:TolC family protein [Deltaproteobacteria bacterium]
MLFFIENNKARAVIIRVLPVFILFALSNCGTVKTTEPLRQIKVPVENFSKTGKKAVPVKWWNHLGIKQLNRLVDSVLLTAPDLKIAVSRLKQSIAVLKKKHALSYPSLSATAGVSAGGKFNEKPASAFNAGFEVSWEIDVWGRLQSSRKSALYDVRATEYEVLATFMTMTGQLVNSYLNIMILNRRADVLTELKATAEKYYFSQKMMYEAGSLESVDLILQNQNLASLDGQLVDVKSQISIEKNNLAVLSGKIVTDVKLEFPKEFPELPDIPKTGVPLKTVSKRPDVMKALNLLRSADAQLAVAVRERLPRFSLSFSVSDSVSKFSDIMKNWLWNIVLNVTAPIWKGGEISAEIERSRAYITEMTVNLHKVILNAINEIEIYLSREVHQKKYIESVLKQIEFSKLAVRDLEIRYKNGVTEFSVYLNALISRQNLELSLISARGELIKIRGGLAKALAAADFNLVNLKQRK